ncbi:hypothetical protein TIFTF001_014073 [Ficus carica]|uniref:Uncharacterized protein n=1 Tax=Ficus carica TaxID=3494 RepID=A0AA87ZW49_FICCA|nr:hypothetical protein TIFTF001_014073 [Ficus carica]
MVGVPMVDGYGDGGELSTTHVGNDRVMETTFLARIWVMEVWDDVPRRREPDYQRWVRRGASLRRRQG